MHNKLLNNRIHRGILILKEYDFEIRYITGKANIVAHKLTRNEQENENNKQLQIGVNILKEEGGIFSRDKISLDQNNLPWEYSKGCTKLGDFYFKKLKENEIYVISEGLDEHDGLWKIWMMSRENVYTSNDLKIMKDIIII